ncbi:MAG TPA: hypothetical protein VHH11_14090 [Gammaproteobacteria bacterium]|nr:hypothetical protein [Gammaproteobacteria bacterium]
MKWRDVTAWVERHPLATLGLAAGGAALLGTGGAVAVTIAQGGGLLGTSGGGTARIAGGSVNLSSIPTNYANDYLSAMLARWSGSTKALGDAVRTMTPVAWPGIPGEVIMGFCTNGQQRANTALSPPNGVENPFAELGYFGTEGGPRSTPPNAGPYPNPTNRSNNSWLVLHDDPLVVRLLGHPATMVNGAWQTDVNAQTAVGLVNLLRHRTGCNAAMPAACRSTDLGSTWSVAVGFAAWSAGDAGMARWVTRYQTALAAVPEPQRVAAWVAAVVADDRAGRVHGTRHANPAYTLMRTLQKIEAGRVLAVHVHGNAAWFPVVSSADQLAITRAAFKT